MQGPRRQGLFTILLPGKQAPYSLSYHRMVSGGGEGQTGASQENKHPEKAELLVPMFHA